MLIEARQVKRKRTPDKRVETSLQARLFFGRQTLLRQ